MTAVGQPTARERGAEAVADQVDDAAGHGADSSTIGAVLARLRPEFPDVTISKIRFLEAEGLVSPDRSAAGYRRFSESDVERLRFVLAAQRDHYLPLKVIRERLDAGAVPVAVPAQPEELSAVALAAPDGALGREELLARTGAPTVLIAELEHHGLLRADAAGRYDDDGVKVVRIAAALGEYGLEPRHLRIFRAAADRELALLNQVAAPLMRQRDRSRGAEQVRDLAGLSVGLHTLLVTAGLRQVAGG
jgi:DNA-binding transcriptional MerR regulator